MEESSSAGIQEEANAYIIDVNENSEIQKEANTSIGNECQNEELYGEANASSENEDQDTKLANVMREMRKSPKPSFSRKCCIYRVPQELSNLNREAYTPQVISIGPFTKNHFKRFEMEKLKERYFDRFVEKVMPNVKELVRTIRDMEEHVRRCYAETIKLSSDDFVKMILLDASFIIVFFLMCKFNEWRSDDDLMVFTPRSKSTVVKDMWLLENQLPFFVIEKLYNFVLASHSNYPSFTELSFEFFADYHTRDMYHGPHRRIKHFLDLLRTFFLPPINPLGDNDTGVKNLYTASAHQLYEAGVKFKVSDSKCLVDLNFKNGVLEIPRIDLNGSTESLFRNLMAFEQFHYPFNAYVTDYIRVLDCLIDTTKDVDLLVQKKILVNGLSHGKAVTTLVNNLCKHVASFYMNSDYWHLCEELNTFYANPRHGWFFSLRRDYFSNPWRTSATLAAIILLVLTFTQTVCSIIALQWI